MTEKQERLLELNTRLTLLNGFYAINSISKEDYELKLIEIYEELKKL